MTAAPSASRVARSPSAVETVTGATLPPPVVPPPSVANPTISVGQATSTGGAPVIGYRRASQPSGPTTATIRVRRAIDARTPAFYVFRDILSGRDAHFPDRCGRVHRIAPGRAPLCPRR